MKNTVITESLMLQQFRKAGMVVRRGRTTHQHYDANIKLSFLEELQ